MTSAPVFQMVWKGKGAVEAGRSILGETNPLASPTGTVRGDFGLDVGRNLCHGSDSVEAAEKEIAVSRPHCPANLLRCSCRPREVLAHMVPRLLVHAPPFKRTLAPPHPLTHALTHPRAHTHAHLHSRAKSHITKMWFSEDQLVEWKPKLASLVVEDEDEAECVLYVSIGLL